MSETCIILTTCGSEETAQEIVEALVDHHHAACASIIPNVRTYYCFDGQTRWDDEYQVLIFTTDEQFEAAAKVIKRLHTYEVPELLLVKVDLGSDEAQAWIRSMGR